jgi:hypothetical protein
MRRAIIFAVALSGCNPADRPQALDVGAEDEVVSLPGGGALILRRLASERQPDQQCWVRARSFRGWISMDCTLAERARP